jgi:uncharacterized repeat protein (TIGR03806 family)
MKTTTAPALGLALAVAGFAGCSSEIVGTSEAPLTTQRGPNATCLAPTRSSGLPGTLSALGCFAPGDPRRVVAGVVTYEPQAPLWSDGAGKPRYFAIPDGTTIHVEPSGHFVFPNGSVLVKSFVLGGRYVETRVLVRYADGGWAGGSYEWNDDQTDASLLARAKTRTLDGQTWTFPGPNQCFRCHNDSAGVTLGPELAQLNGPTEASADNQLEQLAAAGYLDALAGPAATLPRLSRYDSSDPVEARARAYLHGNCSHGHRPGGPGAGPANYRFDVPFSAMNVCNEPASSDPGQVLFAPGASGSSEISVRMHALDGTRMPALGTTVVDPQGTKLVDGWIDATSACPPPAGVNGAVDATAFAACDHAVSFDEVLSQTLASCGGVACHSRPPLAARLALTSTSAYDALVNAPSTVSSTEILVVPGDPGRSLAWRKLVDELGPGEGVPMPRGLVRWQPLAGPSLRTFRCWIEQGAPR